MQAYARAGSPPYRGQEAYGRSSTRVRSLVSPPRQRGQQASSHRGAEYPSARVRGLVSPPRQRSSFNDEDRVPGPYVDARMAREDSLPVQPLSRLGLCGAHS